MDATKDYNFLSKRSSVQPLRKEILEALPLNIRSFMVQIPEDVLEHLEEIRLRTNQPLILNVGNREIMIDGTGCICPSHGNPYIVSKSDVSKAYELITDYSVYALEEEIRNGFITIKGGHRVGICGKTILQGKEIKTIKDISGINIRVSKQKIGISNDLIQYLVTPQHQFYNTLIISPPQCGKTTLLRDIIRNLSNGIPSRGLKGFKIGVVDERSEICGMYQGIPQNDVGIRTDILDACPKAEGMMMLIRSMSPQIIATDEIGKQEDARAMEEALNAGIKIITTVHGSDLVEVQKRPHIRELTSQGIFERILILTNQPRVGTVKTIIDGKTQAVIATYANLDRRCEIIG